MKTPLLRLYTLAGAGWLAIALFVPAMARALFSIRGTSVRRPANACVNREEEPVLPVGSVSLQRLLFSD